MNILRKGFRYFFFLLAVLFFNSLFSPAPAFAQTPTPNTYTFLNGNVGIGKTPTYPLDINGILNATALYVNGAPYIGSQWTTSGSNIYYNSGNVTIGGSGTTSKLDIAPGSFDPGSIYFSGGTVRINPNQDGWSGKITGNGTGWYGYQTNLTLGTSGSGHIVLNPAGNVGIGTIPTASDAKLVTQGSIAANAGYLYTTDGSNGAVIARNGSLFLSGNGGGAVLVNANGNYLYPGTTGGIGGTGGLIVYSGGASPSQQAQIGGPSATWFSQNVGVGTTGPNGKLDVYNSCCNGDGAVFAPDITADNNFTIQSYIDSGVSGGGWGNRTTYAGGCCNNLALQPNVGTVTVGETSSNAPYKFEVAGDIRANGGWLRTTGQAGWYNDTYGGGWNMNDSTWIRSYGGKPVYMANGYDSGSPSGVGCGGGLGGGYMLHVCGQTASSGNIYNLNPSQGWIGLTGDLPGYSNDTYPTLKTNGSCLYFATANQYTGYLCYNSGWVYVSSRDKKENFQDLDLNSILSKISSLPITEWNYKGDTGLIRKHVGPVAEDFHQAFGLNGTDSSTISTIDISGVTLAGVKGLIEKNKQLEGRVSSLENKNAELEKRVETLEKKVDNIINSK